MILDTCHFGIHVHSLEQARAFYVDTLGLELLQYSENMKLMAVRAGGVRLSFIADAQREAVGIASKVGGSVIFRSLDIHATLDRLSQSGIPRPQVNEAPGFMLFATLRDPSDNLVQIAEYLRDPLQVSLSVTGNTTIQS